VLEGRHPEAESPLREAVRISGALPEDSSTPSIYVHAVTSLALLVADTGSFDEAIALLANAEAKLSRRNGLETTPLSAEIADAYAQIGLASVFSHQQVEEWAAKAVALRRKALSTASGNPEARLALANSLSNEGECFERAARKTKGNARPFWEQAKTRFEEARTIAKKLCDQQGIDTLVHAAWERELAQDTGWLGEVELALDPSATQKSISLVNAERDIIEQLIARDPLDWRAQIELAAVEKRLSKAAEDRNDSQQTDIHRARQEEVIARIHRQAPAARTWRLVSMNADFELGHWHLARARKEDAAQHFDLALATGQKLLPMRPDHQSDQDGFRNLAYNISEAWKEVEDWDRARTALTGAISFLERLAISQTTVAPVSLWTAASLERRAAELAETRKNPAEALDHNLAAMRYRADALKSRSIQATGDPNAVPHAFLYSEKSLITLNRIEEAVALAGEALDLRRECARLPLDPNPWAEAIIVAAESGLSAGGQTAQNARILATRTLTNLYPANAASSAPATLAPYTPKPGEAEKHRQHATELAATLRRLASPENGPKPQP
jgi:tetratricopeptide (TPR) repeat protein